MAKCKAFTINNTYEHIPPRLRQTLCCVWNLNDQERSHLHKHFMLIRTKQELRTAHVDNHQLGTQLLNGDSLYDVIFQGISGWEELEENDKVCTSWRLNYNNNLAIVIVRAYTGKNGGNLGDSSHD